MVKVGKMCVEVVPTSTISWISEDLCIGCGICVKVRGGCAAVGVMVGAVCAVGAPGGCSKCSRL